MKLKVICTLALALGFSAQAEISIGGGQDPYADKPVSTFQVAGTAAQELMELHTATAPYTCQRRDYSNPSGGTIHNVECDIRAVVVSVRPVQWWPKDQVGMGQLNIAGPTVNYLIGLGANTTPLLDKLDSVRCSENSFAPGTGTCALVMENIN